MTDDDAQSYTRYLPCTKDDRSEGHALGVVAGR